MKCHRLRNDIIGVMERNVPPETKRSLLKKDVTEFDTLCGEADREARVIFRAAMSEHPAESGAASGAAAPARADAASQRAHVAALAVFGAPGSKEHYGWVSLSRRESGSWVPHFNGYDISDTSLPPPGTILSAKIMLPVCPSRRPAPTIRPNCRAGCHPALACACWQRVAALVVCGPRLHRPHAREQRAPQFARSESESFR
jgi:hypothetical protein